MPPFRRVEGFYLEPPQEPVQRKEADHAQRLVFAAAAQSGGSAAAPFEALAAVRNCAAVPSMCLGAQGIDATDARRGIDKINTNSIDSHRRPSMLQPSTPPQKDRLKRARRARRRAPRGVSAEASEGKSPQLILIQIVLQPS